jgi:hypothetical protein
VKRRDGGSFLRARLTGSPTSTIASIGGAAALSLAQRVERYGEVNRRLWRLQSL